MNIESKEAAALISRSSLLVYRELNDMLLELEGKCSESEYAEVRQAVGKVLGELLLEIVNPIYKKFPELAPDGFF